jgi:hypothetical protein
MRQDCIQEYTNSSSSSGSSSSGVSAEVGASGADVAGVGAGGVLNKRGHWSRYEITGVWNRLQGGVAKGGGCSADTPVACKLLRRLRRKSRAVHDKKGVPVTVVLRAAYSVVEEVSALQIEHDRCGDMLYASSVPHVLQTHTHSLFPRPQGTWIRPHFGMTNSQLKLHLGLIVPAKYDGMAGSTGSNEPCARMRVGNSTRGWEEGKVQRMIVIGLRTCPLYSPW